MSERRKAEGRTLKIRHLGLQPYEEVWEAMKRFTSTRDVDTEDELWILQHFPVFTQGQAGKAEHVLAPGDIPVVQVDRGGQVTYHGPGQLVAYTLLDINRMGVGARELVSLIEQALVRALAAFSVTAAPRNDAPGVYVGQSKIASLGLRIRKGRSFHGLALNVDMDMAPFHRINPCGYAGMNMTQLKELCDDGEIEAVTQELITSFIHYTGYRPVTEARGLPNHD